MYISGSFPSCSLLIRLISIHQHNNIYTCPSTKL